MGAVRCLYADFYGDIPMTYRVDCLGRRIPESKAQFPRRYGQQLDTDWMDDAACRGADPEIFFPITPRNGRGYRGLNEPALRICRICRVRDECLEYAFKANMDDGIWGGTTIEERKRRRKAWAANGR